MGSHLNVIVGRHLEVIFVRHLDVILGCPPFQIEQLCDGSVRHNLQLRRLNQAFKRRNWGSWRTLQRRRIRNQKNWDRWRRIARYFKVERELFSRGSHIPLQGFFQTEGLKGPTRRGVVLQPGRLARSGQPALGPSILKPIESCMGPTASKRPT